MDKLSAMVEQPELAHIIKHHFSDYVLETLAQNDRQLADRMAHTKFSNGAVERLLKAYESNIITFGDLLHISNYSLVSGSNEKYLNNYFSSIAAGLDTKTASQILAAAKFEDWSYNEIYKLVKSGTYAVSNRTFVELTSDVAREIDKLGIELYAYDKNNDFYLVKDIEQAITNGDSITFSDFKLAMKINEMRNLPEWNEFRDYVRGDREEDYYVHQLTASGLEGAYYDYRIEEMNIELSRTVDKNFSGFIDEIRAAGVDEAISRCYEITVKSNIQAFIESEPADLTEEQYKALLTREDPLGEIYESWLTHGDLNTYSDVERAMEYTANAVMESLERQKENERKVDAPKPTDSDDLTDKPKKPTKKFKR